MARDLLLPHWSAPLVAMGTQVVNEHKGCVVLETGARDERPAALAARVFVERQEGKKTRHLAARGIFGE